ncbi:hypothetical protein ACFQU1_07085 [Chelatococcus sp. GCM10030263]|uniref:hypothetical protein n=1 Tax=Chelatococcus sp. GCM10030263 TaxID=3273387 RepID=UPI003613450D
MKRPRIYILDKTEKLTKDNNKTIADIIEESVYDWSKFISIQEELTLSITIESSLGDAIANTEVEYTVQVGSIGEHKVVTSIPAYKATTGTDLNGDAPDININFTYYMVERCLKGDFKAFKATCLHELGHNFGVHEQKRYNFYDAITVFDKYTIHGPYGHEFHGPNTKKIAKDGVPLSASTGTHIASNFAEAFQSPLGAALQRGTSSSLSELDVRIVSDCGLATDLNDVIPVGHFPGQIDGRKGTDTVIIDGDAGSYIVSSRETDWVVAHYRGDYEIELRNVELLQFRDGKLLLDN